MGNNHEGGKIEGEGKAIISKDNKFVKIYKGKIHKNKICCQLLNLNEQSDKAILKIPNISIFNEESVIVSKYHKHKLKYASVNSSWKCDFCSKLFGENIYSFGCRECNFDLCIKCVFDPNSQKKVQNNFKENQDNILNRINSAILNHEPINKIVEEQLKSKTIENGMYIIQPMSYQNKVVQVDNVNLMVSDFKNENNQKFNINYDSSNRCYYIQNIENGQFLTCDNNIIYFDWKNYHKNQQWHIKKSNNNGYEIILEKNKKLLQVEKNSKNRIGVLCQENKGIDNHLFNFESTTKTIPLPPEPKKEEIPVPTVRYFPRPNWHGPYINQVSIVDALASIGYPSNKQYREQIGIRNNIPGIPFSPQYNTSMLDLMKEGKLIIP